MTINTDDFTLTLPQRITLEYLEDFPKKLEQKIDEIRLPSRITFAIGAESALIQWAITWATINDTKNVWIHLDASGDISRVELNSPFLRTIVLLASKIFVGAQKTEFTIPWKKTVKESLTKNQSELFPKANLWDGFCIICVDTQNLRLPEVLYKHDGDKAEVRSLSHFEELFQALTSGEGASLPIFAKENKGIEKSDIPRIIYEVFRNTHDHARTMPNGKRLSNSIRGLYLKIHRGSNRSEDTSTMRYLAGIAKALDMKDSANLDLLEISVFDSGPGLAAHRIYKSNPEQSLQSAQDERRWLERCFERSSTGVDTDENRGFGLNEIQNSLTKVHGYLRIRSGRLSLFRDFQFQPFMNTNASFWDTTNLGGHPQDHGNASGALFTTLIPQRSLA